MLNIAEAVLCLRRGGVIAYPTEAVFGLGCDPNNETAALHLLALKKRPMHKGLILVAAHTQQLNEFVAPEVWLDYPHTVASWPGPHTWLVPCRSDAPAWLTGEHTKLAVRISAHPVVRELCNAFGGAIISTSANISDAPPARNATEVIAQFPQQLSGIVIGETGGNGNVTTIHDAVTGQQLR
ncbi:MAG: Sua5/YciO/YrdC/YwlC family protein [Gammaproteobacteria bacterium]|nr:Sua5/YciO/YrdC/YwlC family protein [Gammaproteobacteria bacterium]